jgi:hypothetical protein
LDERQRKVGRVGFVAEHDEPPHRRRIKISSGRGIANCADVVETSPSEIPEHARRRGQRARDSARKSARIIRNLGEQDLVFKLGRSECSSRKRWGTCAIAAPRSIGKRKRLLKKAKSTQNTTAN